MYSRSTMNEARFGKNFKKFEKYFPSYTLVLGVKWGFGYGEVLVRF